MISLIGLVVVYATHSIQRTLSIHYIFSNIITLGMRARAVGHNSFPTEYNYHYHHIFIIVYVFAFAAFLATPATAREKHVISHNYCAHTENGTQKLETHYVRCGAPSPSPSSIYLLCVRASRRPTFLLPKIRARRTISAVAPLPL